MREFNTVLELPEPLMSMYSDALESAYRKKNPDLLNHTEVMALCMVAKCDMTLIMDMKNRKSTARTTNKVNIVWAGDDYVVKENKA